MENIFANNIFDKGLILKYIRNSCNSIITKNIQSNQKMDRGHEQTFLQRRHTDGQQTRATMLNFSDHQGNASNHKEIIPHTSRNGCYQKGNRQHVLARPWRKGNLCSLLVGLNLVHPLWK